MLRTKKGQPLSKRDFADLLVSSVRSIELVNLYIAQIEAVNPSLNAVVQTRFATARKEAMHCDEVLRTWNVRVKPHLRAVLKLHCTAGQGGSAAVFRRALHSQGVLRLHWLPELFWAAVSRQCRQINCSMQHLSFCLFTIRAGDRKEGQHRDCAHSSSWLRDSWSVNCCDICYHQSHSFAQASLIYRSCACGCA